jgi:hypothetical protein
MTTASQRHQIGSVNPFLTNQIYQFYQSTYPSNLMTPIILTALYNFMILKTRFTSLATAIPCYHVRSWTASRQAARRAWR